MLCKHMKYSDLVKFLSFFAILLSSGIYLFAQSIQSEKSWQGILKISEKDSLKIVLTLSYQNDSLVNAEFDSPDQYVFGIKTSSFKIQNDTLKVVSKQISAHYIAVLNESGSYEGIFTQRNSKKKLLLNPINERPTLNRPQEPKEPYDYIEKELVIKDNYGASLIKGTLTFPSKSLKGTVILISGSGWQDRDESIFGHKPFKVIADFLTQAGYAVFRYDDRASTLFSKSTTHDFVSDVQLIVNYFKNDPKHNSHKIGLIGHSEGGLVAFMAAAENPKIDFLISMAGCSEHFSKIILHQAAIFARAEGFTDQEVKETIEISAKIYKMLSKEDSSSIAAKKYKEIVDDYSKKMTPQQRKKYSLTEADVLSQIGTITSPWFMNLFKIEPEKYLKKIECPVYAINGEKDFQVNYATNLPIIEKYISKKSEKSKVESFPNLNHLFQECETGLLDEYGKIEQTISPKVLNSILLWMDLVCNP